LHYIFDFFSANRPQTRINKGSCLFATLESVEDGFDISPFRQSTGCSASQSITLRTLYDSSMLAPPEQENFAPAKNLFHFFLKRMKAVG
jgi:hypothetical protein